MVAVAIFFDGKAWVGLSRSRAHALLGHLLHKQALEPSGRSPFTSSEAAVSASDGERCGAGVYRWRLHRLEHVSGAHIFRRGSPELPELLPVFNRGTGGTP